MLASLCSYYIGYAAFFLAVVYLVAGVIARGRRAVGRLPSLVLALAAAAATVAAVSVPYLLLQRRHLIPHYEALGFANVGFVGMMRFGLRGLLWNYLVPGRDVFPHFLTYTALALAVVALLRHRSHPRAALVAIAIGGIVLGLGPVLFTPRGVVPLPYQLFARIVPGFSAMRVPYRFGALASLGVVSLAGLGLAATASARRRWRSAKACRPSTAGSQPTATAARCWSSPRARAARSGRASRCTSAPSTGYRS